MQLALPPNQRENFLTALWGDLRAQMDDEEVTPDRAFALVVLDSLGYDAEQGFLADGPGDHGLDYAYLAESTGDIFQFKSHDWSNRVTASDTVSPDDLTDLPRIMDLMERIDAPPPNANQVVKQALSRLSAIVTRYRDRVHKDDEPFHLTVYFATLASSFTSQSQGEFDAYAKPRLIKHNETQIQITVRALLLDDIIAARWLVNNTDWKDAQNINREKIDLTVIDGNVLPEEHSCVFYTYAYELVQAYRQLGHQLFEPNVRCAIKRSKVNDEIKRSVLVSRGRKEFRHLNNGITMICDSFQKVGPKEHPRAMRVVHPGVINGLQTVTALEEGFGEIDDSEQKEFKDKCHVLVRLHNRSAVRDYRDLVKSTNNQNPMQARNLRSNDLEHISYEKLFATIGWFYERKQGAWHAFKSNPRLWTTLPNCKPKNFQIGQTRSYRVADNSELAQCWLSFIGFSNEAVHERKRIFDDEHVYELVFLRRPQKHGADYDFRIGDTVLNEAAQCAPDHQLMLCSFLLRSAAKSIVPSHKANRDNAIERLKLADKPREEQEKSLLEDQECRLNRILSAWSFLFPEFVGYILFRSFGDEVHGKGRRLSETPSFVPLIRDRDPKTLADRIAANTYKADDVLPVFWRLFEHCARALAADGSVWLRQWQNTPTRTRFNYSVQTRRLLFQELEELNKYVCQQEFIRAWASEINSRKGVFNYVRKVLS